MDKGRRLELPKCSASKVTDFRRYHLSGDLDEVVQGKVSGTVKQIEAHATAMNPSAIPVDATQEQLQQMIKEQKENSSKLQQQMEVLQLRNTLEAEQMQQQQWELTIQKLKQTRDMMTQQHEVNMTKISDMAEEAGEPSTGQAVAWMQDQFRKMGLGGGTAQHPLRHQGRRTLKELCS